MKMHWILAAGLVAGLGCGGTGTEPVDNGPTQKIAGEFAGTDESLALHVHVFFVQSGRKLTLVTPCVPQDNCRLYGRTPAGVASLGGLEEVDLASMTGTLTDPGISFTMTTTNGRTFNFVGNAAESKVIGGTLTGPGHPASRLQLDIQ